MIARRIVGAVVLTLITFSGFLTRVLCAKTMDRHPINADDLITRNIHFEGDKFWSNTVEHIGDCAVLCVRMTKCMSFNFDMKTLVCELNSDHLVDADRSGRSRPSSVYSNIRNWPRKIDPECYDRPCQEDEVCIPTNIAKYMASSSRCLKAWRHAHCEDGWVFHGNSCYYFSTDKKNWTQASDWCKSEGSKLVDIKNKYEDWFVRHTLMTQRPEDDPNSAYYMNGNDIEEDASWVWGYPGGEEMTYTNWYQGEPSRNNEPESELDEDCAAYYGNLDYKWVDVGCDWNINYICKKPMV